MQTITFYSYKGGVGRTLAVANMARYLARFGQKVFAIDFDLEAPGLHYKFSLDGQGESSEIELGVVDYVYAFAIGEEIPASLREYAIEVERRNESGGSIHLMPAGNAPSAKYWRRLAQINWHELFYSEGAKGIPFFLEFKERIEKEFAPDFLLIDSRTGITEMGGIATTILPDKVICFLLNNRENMEGAREVLRSIKRAPQLGGQAPVEILPVVTRIPKMEKPDVEERIVNEIRDFLNEEADDLSDTLNIPEVFILHSEPDLQVLEALRIGGDKSPDESPLLRDYLRLFARLISKDVIEPYIGPLIKDAVARALDDPEGAQRDLEVVTASYPHPEAYRTLIKFYRLRKAKDEEILRTASRFWELTAKADEPLLWNTVREHYTKPQSWEKYPVFPEFIEDVWDAAGANNVEVGLLLAEHYDSLGQVDRAANVLLHLLYKTEPVERVAVRCIHQLRKAQRWQNAFEVIERFKPSLAESSEFQTAWARLIVAKGDEAEAERLLEILKFHVERIKEEDLGTYAHLLSLAGRTEELNAVLERMLTRALVRGEPSSELAEVGEMFERFGRWQEFEQRVRQSLGSETAQDFLRRFHMRLPLRRWLPRTR